MEPTGSPRFHKFMTDTTDHTATQVREYVDGVRVAVNNGSPGPINNTKPFTVGGKLNCDQINVTCDYFSGDIDYAKVTQG